MNAPDLARFQPPSYAEEAAAAAEAIEQRFAREHAEQVAMSAMLSGIPEHPVDRAHSAETLADMLSMHTCNYRTDIDGPSPVDLLCKLLAQSLSELCRDSVVHASAKAFAQRIQADYVLSRSKA